MGGTRQSHSTILLKDSQWNRPQSIAKSQHLFPVIQHDAAYKTFAGQSLQFSESAKIIAGDRSGGFDFYAYELAV